jgi:hypothetical protein
MQPQWAFKGMAGTAEWQLRILQIKKIAQQHNL